MADGWVLQIAGCYIDMARERGGVANVVRRISLGLADSGQQTLVVCGNREMRARQGDAGSYDIQPGRLRMQVFGQRIHPLLGPTRPVRRFLRELRDVKVAHVHTCFSALTERCMLELQDLGIPYVFTPHGKLSPSMFAHHGAVKRRWWEWIGRRAVAGASRIAALSPQEAAGFTSLGLPGEAAVVPNGYESGALAEAAAKPRRLVDGKYVLFLGYLDPRKQPEFAVRMFSQSKTRETHKLVIVGPDSYGHRGVVERVIEECGVKDRVVLYGPAYGDDKWQLLLGADCFVLPSLGEGLPVALCEALGAKVPVLMSSACNFSEAASGRAGIELEGFDAARWSAAMDTICQDEAVHERMKQAAGELARKYTWDSVISQWAELYEQVAGKASAKRTEHVS